MSTKIPVKYINSQYRAMWIFPGYDSIFSCIQVWSWEQ